MKYDYYSGSSLYTHLSKASSILFTFFRFIQMAILATYRHNRQISNRPGRILTH